MTHIRLHQYPAIWNLPSLSPFCLKVETYLRMAEIPYETVIEIYPWKGPRGRMPFIENGSTVISDSRLILEHFEKIPERSLDAMLSPTERAVSTAFHRLLDQDLIRVILYSRWVDPQGWNLLKREFCHFFPPGLKTISLNSIRSGLLAEARGSGIMEFKRSEVYALGDLHLQAISDYLGDSAFFFGKNPTSLDAALYGFLSIILGTPTHTPLRATLLTRRNLVTYIERVGRTYFPQLFF